MNPRNPHDLTQIRPSAELDRSHRPMPATAGRPPRSRRQMRGRPRPPRQGWSWFGRIAAGLAAVVVLTGIGLAGLFYFVSPAELVRSELIRQVRLNTGRTLEIKGGSRVLFYPSIGVSLGKVSLSGPPGMAASPTLTAERIDVRVALLPLIERDVRVEHIGLVRPVIDLWVDRNGRRSWDFAEAGATAKPRRVRLAQLGAGLGTLRDVLPAAQTSIFERTSLPAAAGLGFLDKLELRSVALTQAVVSYSDEVAGVSHRLDDLDLQLTGRRIADPLSAKGALLWHNERLEFDARLDTLAQLLAGREAKARVTVAGRPGSAGFDGSVKLGKEPGVTGQTRIGGDSLAQTARWLGMDFPNAAPLGGFQVSGRLVASSKSIALNGAAIKLGETAANGTVLVALRPTRPYLSADLKMSELDIDRLSAGFAGGQAVPASPRRPLPRGVPVSPNKPGEASPQSIEDLLRRSQMPPNGGVGRFSPQVRGYTNRNEWSAEPIDASALGLLDAKARLSVDGLKVAGLRIGRTVVRLALASKAARADIDDIQLYEGRGKGVITVRPATNGVGIGANLRVDKVAAKPLLKDAAGFERLDGSGRLTVVVSGAGATQKAIADSLNGDASFAFADGAIVGWNIAKIIRGLQQGQFSNLGALPTEKTDFSELSATFKITNGVASTNDLKMVSPLLRLAGTGNIGVGARNLDLALRPKLVSSLAGQGGAAGAAGLEIPVKLKGPWHDPRIVPDMNSLTKDPGQLLNQAQQLGRQFKGKSVGDIVRGVLGNGGDGNDQDAQSGTGTPQQILKQFWK